MFKRILVPIESTDHSAEALSLARHLAEHGAARIILVRVEPKHASNDDVSAHKAALEDETQRLRLAGFDAYALIEFDRPEDGISTAARYQRSDVIVMAPRHRSGLQALRHPSVTMRMFSHSPAPLLIWPGHAPDEEPRDLLPSAASLVIVPLDGSEIAEHALPYATAFAADFDRTLLLVRVVPRITLIGAGAGSLLLEAEAQQDENRKALRYLKELRRHIARDTSVAVQTALRIGDPAHELLLLAGSHAESLIVMATHGRGGIARAVVGSVTSKVVQEATIPILVVPTGHELGVAPPETVRRRHPSGRM
ncbi:MAG TPA: universal stress protein [Ktedonobacterales bacterium]|nr:universal stress protein [Ktedonobacterales bacterium]